jgi:hypothetical protein
VGKHNAVDVTSETHYRKKSMKYGSMAEWKIIKYAHHAPISTKPFFATLLMLGEVGGRKKSFIIYDVI